ncbi:hypothetical protein V6N11_015630 [Hibiscus sabdariffa]|uniref:Uncharacterized protein n=1 Tax=Hibiscus sabdariffa TaxID=183260 RepID=A0ABR2TSZ1_9ROSI
MHSTIPVYLAVYAAFSDIPYAFKIFLHNSLEPSWTISHAIKACLGMEGLPTLFCFCLNNSQTLLALKSPQGGSRIASDILRGQLVDSVNLRKLMEILICKVLKYQSCSTGNIISCCSRGGATYDGSSVQGAAYESARVMSLGTSMAACAQKGS